MMVERGVPIDHVTIWRWVQHYAPMLNQQLRRELRRPNRSWRGHETYVKVAGNGAYLYRAVDSAGDTIDFLLSPKRVLAAANSPVTVRDRRDPAASDSRGWTPCNRQLPEAVRNQHHAHEADHLAMGMSLIASTRGVGLLPAYAQNFLPSSVTSRPLKGDTPTVDLVLGYKKSNQSPIPKLLLSRLDELVARASK
jgi:DNA-binding transcriptional LysR family regulator